MAIVMTVAVAASARASIFDPAHRYRTIATDHFVIHFHQGEDALAGRLAAIAEDVWRRVGQALGAPPPARTQVVIADESELANGSATPLPYDTIVVTAAWPPGAEFIGNTDDWLRLVFTHEFTHVAHLDRSGGWARVARLVFGRTPIAFPNLFLPSWQIEGLATFEESALTGAGRLHAGDFGAIVRDAARAGRAEPLDRANGGLTDWPGGTAAYAYGSEFHRYLADTYGAETFGELAEATARRFPYVGSPVFERIYGESLGELWRDFEASAAAAAPVSAADAGVVQLTHRGFVAAGPRFAPPACPSCPREIVFSVRTPDRLPTMRAMAENGSNDRALTTRYLGSTSGVSASTIVFDQQEFRRNTSLYADLYALDRATGGIAQLTSEARVTDPDLAPDGSTIVAVQAKPGRRDLVLVRLKPGPATVVASPISRTTPIDTLLSEPEAQFDAPRWSADGRLIAVERHRPGARSEIVVVDPVTRGVRVVASAPATRFVTPAWRPDGAAIIAAAAPDDQPFNLVEIDARDTAAGSMRALTHTSGGALWPDVSADGSRVVFVAYTNAGYDVFAMPYPPSSNAVNTGGAGLSGLRPDRSPERAAPPEASNAAPYSPLGTLAPTAWSPIFSADSHQSRVGAAIAGTDVLGYHTYAASASWLVSPTTSAPVPNRATPDWDVVYAYGRWRPALWGEASSQTTFFAGPPTSSGAPADIARRELDLQAGVLLPVAHVRVSQLALASIVRATAEDTQLTSGDAGPSTGGAGLSDLRTARFNRTALRAAWAIDSSHTFGYSISPERGVAFGTTLEAVRRGLGATADATSLTADLRAYLPAFGTHDVVALRVAGGATRGSIAVGRIFDLGGASPNLSTIDFGSGALSLLRGFGQDAFAGTHVSLFNAEYRFPLARPQRGHGTFPLFVHALHGAIFADAGNVWVGRFDRANTKTSAGGELSIDVVAGYALPLTVSAGVAYARDPAVPARGGAAAYVRVGRSF